MDRLNLINQTHSTEKHFCEGAFGASQKGSYFLGCNFAVAKVNKQFSHYGSSKLDEINAFDQAEIANAHTGQINAIVVSSFCGPKGIIWGYDICSVPKTINPWGINENDVDQSGLAIWDIKPLVNAYARLTGTVEQPHFPFLPGTHVPCAMKSIVREGPGCIYVAHGCGIPVNRERHACVLMEDVGILPDILQHREEYIKDIMINLSKSILTIGKNQQVQYSEIFIGIEHITIATDEIGCALAASPYFTLAQGAFPKSNAIHHLSLEEWEATVASQFLYNSETKQ